MRVIAIVEIMTWGEIVREIERQGIDDDTAVSDIEISEMDFALDGGRMRVETRAQVVGVWHHNAPRRLFMRAVAASNYPWKNEWSASSTAPFLTWDAFKAAMAAGSIEYGTRITKIQYHRRAGVGPLLLSACRGEAVEVLTNVV